MSGPGMLLIVFLIFLVFLQAGAFRKNEILKKNTQKPNTSPAAPIHAWEPWAKAPEMGKNVIILEKRRKRNDYYGHIRKT